MNLKKFLNDLFAKKPKTKVLVAQDEWRTLDGRILPINKMEDLHLVNTVSMLRKLKRNNSETPNCYGKRIETP